MDKCRINIVIIEPSDIIFEGLSILLLKAGQHIYLYRISDFDELSNLSEKEKINIVIQNPVILQNRMNYFTKLKSNTLIFYGLD